MKTILTEEQLVIERNKVLHSLKSGKGLCYRETGITGRRGYYLLDNKIVKGQVVKSLVEMLLIYHESTQYDEGLRYHWYKLSINTSVVEEPVGNEAYLKIEDIDKRLNIISKELRQLAGVSSATRERLNKSALLAEQAQLPLFSILAEYY